MKLSLQLWAFVYVAKVIYEGIPFCLVESLGFPSELGESRQARKEDTLGVAARPKVANQVGAVEVRLVLAGTLGIPQISATVSSLIESPSASFPSSFWLALSSSSTIAQPL